MRCPAKACHVHFDVVETSSYFLPAQATRASLAEQCHVLQQLVLGINKTQIHLATGLDHKLVDRLADRYRACVQKYVEHVQSSMVLGGKWQEGEADEVCLRKD